MKPVMKNLKDGSHDGSKEERVVSIVGNKKIVSITEAARINNVTRQAIYVAIKLRKLRAVKETSRWMINLEDLN